MSNNEKGISEKYTKTKETEEAVKTEISFERELPCVIVYSERRHVEYIYAFLAQIEKVLIEKGFKPQRLGQEIRSGEDYFNKLEKIIKDCVLGVVILDGFRPNVLFEFGYLKGKKKPIIILQSKDACICVKTLYQSTEYSGLSPSSFNNKLKNPPIDIQYHFSDFAGKHIAYMDWTCKDTEPHHPSVVLIKELEKIEEQIIEETKNVKTRNIPAPSIQEMLPPIMNIIKYYYMDPTKCNVNDIRKVHTQITSIAEKHKFQLPYEIYSMIASTYTSKAEDIKLDILEVINSLNAAINIFKEILKSVSVEDKQKIADTQKRMGDIYRELSQYRDKKDNSNKAIKAYETALEVYTLEEFPEDYAMIQNNLGNAYNTLADVEDKGENCSRAIDAYEEALKVYTLERFPMDYAMTQNNLGSAYQKLADVEDKAENCNKAIEAFKKALKVRTLEGFPMQYAATQNNLGNAYQRLANVEDKAENCKRAMKAYKEALKVFTKEEFPEPHNLVQSNIRILIAFCEGK